VNEEQEPIGAQSPDPRTEVEQPEVAVPAESGSPSDAVKTAPAAKPKRPPRNPALLRAFRTETPVRGTVTQVIKGGYEVQIDRSRGFCPHSQIDLHREENPEQQVGRTYMFRITQVRRGGEDVVLSRRAVLEEVRTEEAKAVRATLVEGSIMQGHVASIADFGAFVDLGAGVMGLAHVSEVSHRRVDRVGEAVSMGETVQVKILKINDKTGRISLSLRQAQDDPWSDVATRFLCGETYRGVVRRIAEFGAFVELAPGLEALAPASEFPPSPDGWNSGLEVGAEREWLVLSVDAKARRLSLALPGENGSDVVIEPEAEIEGTVQRAESFGVFVWLRPGSVGLMPREWTGLSRDVDLRRNFRIGQKLDVRVVEVDESGRRIRLAKKGVEARAEPPERVRREQRSTEPRPQEDQGTFGSILGDKLRAILGGDEPPS
jgi:small subunit ribosomal protein S1